MLLVFFTVYGCTPPQPRLTENTASLECLLDNFLAEFALDENECLWVHESTGWSDSTSLLMISAYDHEFLDLEIVRGKQAATYRGHRVIYCAQRTGLPKARVFAAELLPTDIAWSPIDTIGLPASVMIPPYDPPVVQVVYNHQNHEFEEVLLMTSAMGVPGCGTATK